MELGAWVLGEACRTVVSLDRGRGAALNLSVNLSARQLLEPGLEATVAAALRASGLHAARLTLEITESVLMADTAATIDRLGSLRGLGMRVAIDDFGTGYSSLGYLRRFPLDAVKIDRSFIEDVTEGTRQAALVHAIVELCRTLELDTVAEGVETREQAIRLAELGCELAQGFYFGRPMPARDLARRLASCPTRPCRPCIQPRPRSTCCTLPLLPRPGLLNSAPPPNSVPGRIGRADCVPSSLT